MSRKIYIDGLGLVEGHFSGVGHYILGVIQGLDELIEKAKLEGGPAPKVTIIIPYDKVKKFKKFGFKHIGYRRFPMPFRIMSGFWYRGWLPPLDLLFGRGIYIFPRFVSMPLLFSPSLLVIFDLSFELHRQYSDDRNAAFLSKGVRKSIKRASKVITISQNARREILDFYNLSEDKVSVATPATDSRTLYRRDEKEIKKVKDKYGIEGDYILALSNLEPRKNLGALIDVYCSLPKKVTDKLGLLLVGVNGWKTDELFSNILERVEAGYRIMRPDHYVTDADRPAVISGAKMLVYPSHYEGFGMPPLEAMACGLPVISADNSSLPEVMGRLGVLVPSDDNQALLGAISSYLENIDSITSDFLTAGPEQSRRFNWLSSAQVYLDAVREIDK